MELKEILNSICEISGEALDAIVENATLVRVKKGESVIRQGDRANIVLFIRQGIFRMCFTAGGKERTLAFGIAGDPFTSVHSYMSGLPSLYSFEAVVDSEIWTIPISVFKQLVETYPQINRWLMTLLLVQIEAIERRSVLFGGYNATKRYEIFVYNRPEIFRFVPSKYIAQYLDIAPETLSRIQTSFVKS